MSILAAKLMAPHRSLGRHVLPLGYCITQDFYSEDLGTKKIIFLALHLFHTILRVEGNTHLFFFLNDILITHVM